MKTLAALVVLASGTHCLAAQPVQEYTRDGVPSRSEGMRSIRPLVPAADPRDGLLITPAPYPSNRTDDVAREQNGRLWITRGPVGNRSPLSEATRGGPGPASFGAGPESLDELLFVQPSDLRSVVAISPWQDIDARTLKQIQRIEPNLGKTVDSPESERLLNELRAAQHQWLREEGYILRVRTHTSGSAVRTADASSPQPAKDEIKPRAVIRVVPQAPAPTVGRVAQAAE
jgi:hypothetical protein